MKKKLFICILFLALFCFGIDGVRAATVKETCFYSGQLKDTTVNTNGTEKGNQTFAVAIEYSCNTGNNKCTSKYAAGYTDSNQKSQTISFKNDSEVFGKATNYANYFYKDKKITCPNEVVINGNATDGVSFTYDCAYGQAANGECLGVATKLSKQSVPSGDTLADKVKSVTDLGHYSSNQAVTNPGNSKSNNSNGENNKKYIDSIRKRADSQSKDVKDNNKQFGNLNNNTSCTSLLGQGDKSIAPVIKNVFFVMCVIGVVILVLTVSGDFIKAIVSSENDALAAAFKAAKTRIISTIILLLLPILVNFIVDLINDHVIVITDSNNNNTEVKIGNVSDCNIVD